MNCFGCLNPTQEIPHEAFSTDPIPLCRLKGLKNPNSIGEGSFATVFRGIFDGQDVALKRLKAACDEDSEEFLQFVNESNTLSRCNHPNIVKYFGYCIEKGNKILVLEYFSQGSLYTRLHGPANGEPLTWVSRIRIALDVAAGISYIQQLDPPVIHADIKSDNVLLGEDGGAKVSDFGTAIVLPVGAEFVGTDSVIGTFGYLDPCYLQSRQISFSSDIYSFGVLLLEIGTGRQATDGSGWSLVQWASREVGHGRTLDIIDPVLAVSDHDAIVMFLELAVSCVNIVADRRPDISSVVTDLTLIGNTNLVPSD